MRMTTLGRSGIDVSRVCLGTMTFGEQNNQDEAFSQMDLAFDAGVTFLDAAEMYPIAPSARTYGDTERIVGAWTRARGNRDKVVIASKIVGPGNFPWIRGGAIRHDRASITAALDASLQRSGLDYFDLYYLHWPERPVNSFGRLGYVHDDTADPTPLAESLDALAEMVRAGKIRAVGLSNETPWGVMHALARAEGDSPARIAAVQNPYNLVNRTYEIGLAEISIREDVACCAYSPLGGGVLSGKYLHGARPAGARLTRWPDRYGRYTGARTAEAIAAYVDLARLHGLDPAQMAIAYAASRRFMGSVIIGATTEEHLRVNLAAAEIDLSEEVIEGIEAIHAANPNPAP